MPHSASTNGQPKSSTNYIAELQKRATVDRTEANKYAVRRWLHSASRLYGQGDCALRNKELDMAYVYYFRGCSIILELLPDHSHYNEIKRDPLYINLKNRANDEILGALESIGAILEKRYGGASSELEKVMEKYPPVSGVSPESTGQDSNKYAALESLSLDDLPPVPMHAPQAKRPSQPTPPPLPPPSHRFNISLPPPPPPPEIPKAVPAPSMPPVNNEQTARITFPVPLTIPPPPSSQQQSDIPKPIVTLPPRTNNAFPSTPSIDPATLMRWITKKENQPSILILDVRPRAMHDQGCIRHKWICQIEPLVLRRDVTSMKIQESLVMNPEVEQFLFSERDKFDLVVYYDQDSQRIQNANEPLKNLHSAIYELEFRKYLPRMPMLLAGGFDAWESVAKEKGIYRAKKDTAPAVKKDDNGGKKLKEGHRPPLVWLKDLVGKGPERSDYEPVTVHHTVYDYFNHKRNDGALQSMSRTNQTPPLQGIFNHTLSPPLDTSYPTSNLSMPSPQILPTASQPAESNNTSAFKYPDIKPNTSSANTRPAASGSAIQRRNTFIDNPFHGFTGTQSQLYDKPPIPAKPTRHLPPPPPPAVPSHGIVTPPRSSSAGPVETQAPPLPFKPSSLTVSHQSVVDSRYTPVSDSSVSQMGSFTIGTMGLKNLGNTCFMSSIIQCLSGTIPLARYLISGTFKHDINKTNPLGTGGVLAESFAALLRAMWTENCSFLSPATFREALVRFAPQFSGNDQQDSQEFLMFLMDGLHEDVNRVVKRPPPEPEDPEEEERFEKLPDWQASAIAWEKYLARNASIIVSLFQGQYRSRLTCLTCGKTSTTYNVFMSLSLPIPAKGNTPPSVTLYQCFDRFFKEEILENDDAWNCPRCKMPRRAKKQLTLSRLPDVLLIHLKRFSYDGPFHNKLETLVNYPVRGLDLTPYLPNSMFPPKSSDRPVLKYDLYGVSNHYGSLTGGHYTACVHNGYRGEWHYFDDTRVSVCDESKVVSRAGYNLFYVRHTVK